MHFADRAALRTAIESAPPDGKLTPAGRDLVVRLLHLDAADAQAVAGAEIVPTTPFGRRGVRLVRADGRPAGDRLVVLDCWPCFASPASADPERPAGRRRTRPPRQAPPAARPARAARPCLLDRVAAVLRRLAACGETEVAVRRLVEEVGRHRRRVLQCLGEDQAAAAAAGRPWRFAFGWAVVVGRDGIKRRVKTVRLAHAADDDLVAGQIGEGGEGEGRAQVEFAGAGVGAGSGG